MALTKGVHPIVSGMRSCRGLEKGVSGKESQPKWPILTIASQLPTPHQHTSPRGPPPHCPTSAKGTSADSERDADRPANRTPFPACGRILWSQHSQQEQTPIMATKKRTSLRKITRNRDGSAKTSHNQITRRSDGKANTSFRNLFPKSKGSKRPSKPKR